MSEPFELTPHQDPEPLPRGKQLKSWDQLVGHTIKAVVDGPLGEYYSHTVIITETNCWMALEACVDYSGDAPYISTYPSSYSGSLSLSDFIGPMAMLLEGIIKKEKAKKAEIARLLRQQLEDLEKD